ncbi:MAG: hypothetical protein JRI96_16900 [Deltaproteobacteria bacterium]|nr:hypothetical protein [Deltaproteobacteria bacterium]
MKKLSIIAILVIFCAVFGFAKVNTANAVQPIRLGLLLPYTGAWAWVGAGADPGAELAVQEINADRTKKTLKQNRLRQLQEPENFMILTRSAELSVPPLQQCVR